LTSSRILVDLELSLEFLQPFDVIGLQAAVPVLLPVPGRLGGLQMTADLSQGLFVGQ
jgi:hypothetical protein